MWQPKFHKFSIGKRNHQSVNVSNPQQGQNLISEQISDEATIAMLEQAGPGKVSFKDAFWTNT